MTTLLIIFVALIVIGATTALFLQTAPFGALPEGLRLENIEKSPNYRDGSFQNLSHTPDLSEGVSYWDVIREFIFTKKVRMQPSSALPSQKTDLLNLLPDEQVLVWFGHSSYFMQIDGKRILVDPVMSGSASPLPFGTRAFPGTDVYTTDDIPNIDILLISHDHWDHLDHEALKNLRPKIGKVYTGLGTGAHLEAWGFDPAIITESDWNAAYSPAEGFTVTVLPARHFSGRGIKRNKALWVSFALRTPHFNIYVGGDSGYDSHFAAIGAEYGPFDFALLENGQYDKSWKYIHMMPEQVLEAASDLRAKRLMPVHSSKFSLGNHPWDEPLKRITAANAGKQNLVTPMIGEKVELDRPDQIFTKWWEGID